MKIRYRILSGMLGMLLLSGCAPISEEAEKGTTAASPSVTADAQTYREVILQLQQQLEEMRQAQLQQAEEYEREIAELEAVIAGMTASDGSGAREDILQKQFAYTVADGGAVISSYLGADTVVEIPSVIDGYPVVKIGEGAFRNSSVEQVVLKEGVQTVDWFAFYGSYRLRSVTLPASVSLIEYGAFELCSSSLKFTCPSNSYAAKYAESYGITVVNSDG